MKKLSILVIVFMYCGISNSQYSELTSQEEAENRLQNSRTIQTYNMPLNKNSRVRSGSSKLFLGVSPHLGIIRENSRTYFNAEAEISLFSSAYLSSLLAGIEFNTKDSNNSAINLGFRQFLPILGMINSKTSAAFIYLALGIGYYSDFQNNGISFDIALGGAFAGGKSGGILNLPRVRLIKYFKEDKKGAFSIGVSYTHLFGL